MLKQVKMVFYPLCIHYMRIRKLLKNVILKFLYKHKDKNRKEKTPIQYFDLSKLG